MKYFFLSYIFVGAIIVSAFGFRGSKSELPPIEVFPDMDHQAKVKYQASSDFFADGRGARLPVKNTVPMGFEIPAKAAANGAKPARFGFTNGLDYYNTGKMGDFYGDGLPVEITSDASVFNEAFLKRGEQRYNIHCAICHGTSGNGKGVTSKYGILTAFNFQQPGNTDPANAAAFRADGAIFDVITNGKGLMGSYGGNITVRDRWAIVAYIRALQLAAKESGATLQ
ncbi:MAG: cytochrome c [Prosthecobacter sp.]|jgi:mono/diheme cytochrome c family protein|uniref:c-type cytochrome n=1 Tax=Prosthecobacter sp. TaxID=1965333 RepID=UPI0019DB9AF4|nr:cytochrome c [Prosthecobacter sp.]MBE2284172.1 cytochrome c [Prosthecobacter sp.]